MYQIRVKTGEESGYSINGLSVDDAVDELELASKSGCVWAEVLSEGKVIMFSGDRNG